MVGINMSTYFESINNEDVLQINDEYKTPMIVRKGEVMADYTKGECYGFKLLNNEDFATFKVDGGKLYISPMYIYDGYRVYYVASDGKAIKYKVYGKDFTPEVHGVGLEVFNKNGQMIYSTNYETSSYKMFHTEIADTSIGQADGRDSSYLKIWHNISPWSTSSQNYWKEYKYSGVDPYILSHTIPWAVVGHMYDKGQGYPYSPYNEYGAFYTAGFVFINKDTFTTECHTNAWRATRLIGAGDLHQLGKCIRRGPKDYYYGHIYNFAGILTINYMFSVFERL